MGALDNAAATRLLSASLGIAAHVAPTTPMRLRLYTATGSAAATGTEVTGGSYTPQPLAGALGTVTNGVVSNTAAVTFTSLPAATITATEVWDSNGTPRREWWAALTASKVVGAGDSLSFPAGSLSWNINV